MSGTDPTHEEQRRAYLEAEKAETELGTGIGAAIKDALRRASRPHNDRRPAGN